ncbi:hypothetical protein GJAV_G00076210 [Gymnothorax javanicus]|nr:hypothetical protein GJAV_G00076210 [Gymnothorax javanicus]
MQEESGELESSKSNGVLAWSCPLCQQGLMDREALALHLTQRHSVLPACLDRLLETAVPVDCTSEENVEDKALNDISTPSPQQMHWQTSRAPSGPLDADLNTERPNQLVDNALVLSGSGDKIGSCHEKEIGEGAIDQEETEDSLESELEKTEASDSMKSENRSSNAAVDKSRATVSGETFEKFLDPNCPFKCHTCLESFTSKSALSIHYSSPTHLQRIRAAWAKQGGENDTQPNAIRPFNSSKPYQCTVCCVSYNHAITLESHLKSVLHQTRNRNSVMHPTHTQKNVCSVTENSESWGTGDSLTATSSTAFSEGNTFQATSITTENFSKAGGLAKSGITTKDEEQVKAHSVLSLLSSPVASAQAASAFLTLLPSSSPSLSPSLLPSLLTVNASASPATPAAQLISQQQLLLPLFVNGLHRQDQSPRPEPSNPVLTPPASILSLNAAQQTLLAQRLSYLQSLGLAVGHSVAAPAPAKEETRDAVEDKKMMEEQHSPTDGGKPEGEEDTNGKGSMSEKCEHLELTGSNLRIAEKMEGKSDYEEFCGEINQPSLTSLAASNEVHDDSPSPGNMSLASNTSLSPIHLNLTLSPDTTPQKSHTDTSQSPSSNPSPNHSSRHSPNRTGTFGTIRSLSFQDPAVSSATVKTSNPEVRTSMLSEFQNQVLWAFLESRSEVDAASPPQEDCEALSLELGLEVEEVRKWLCNAWESRYRAKHRTTHASNSVIPRDSNVVDPETTDEELEEGEGELMIVAPEGCDSPARHSSAMDLSGNGGKGRDQDSENHGDDSYKEELYTSVIVTDEESQESSMRKEPGSPERGNGWELEARKKNYRGGKVLRSSTVFLSDAEDEEDDEDGDAKEMKRKRKQDFDDEEDAAKRERLDPDVDLELEAQADPPASLSASLSQHCLPGIAGSNILHSLPLSLSLNPFATKFISPYVVQLPASAVTIGLNAGEENQGNSCTFTNPPVITRSTGPFSDPLNAPPPASQSSPPRFLPNGGECETALDLSIGKNHSSSTSSSSTTVKEAIAQRDRLLDGLGFKPTTVDLPGAGGLVLIRVKPEHALAITPSNISSNANISSSNAKTNSASKSQIDRERDKDKKREKESERDGRSPKAQRYKDMRRSRTIIHTEQLDVLYGCYFKDPNPGKLEFEQIAEWVRLPKKVVQIWFQNMRARERKGEVRFISDGTLAAVGKPLIKFTWPLKMPIFSSRPKSNVGILGSVGVTKTSAANKQTLTPSKTNLDMQQMKDKEKVLLVPGPKVETPTSAAKVKILPKIKEATAAVPEVITEVQPPLLYSSMKCKADEQEKKRHEEEEITDEEDEQDAMEKIRPGTFNRMIPKQSASTSLSTASGSHKHNGLNYWSSKGPFKINTLTREQLGLATVRTPSVSAPAPSPAAATSTPPPTIIRSSQVQRAFVHHSTPRRPRTHLSSLQLSILQSCYETCAHPNALECEAVGTALGLPLKVVQIWFQNTRAKEKRWKLQQDKQFSGATDSKKAEFCAATYLQYSALRANRPILPKPVHLIAVEPTTTSVLGQTKKENKICNSMGDIHF